MSIQSSNTITEEYKKKQFLNAIKTGRIAKRVGLGTRIFLLAGIDKKIPFSSRDKNPHKIKTELTHRLCYRRNTWQTSSHDIYDKLYSDKMKETLNKYMGDVVIESNWAFMFVYYNPDNVSCWSVLDHDLKMMYPSKTRIDKKTGYVYYKFR